MAPIAVVSSPGIVSTWTPVVSSLATTAATCSSVAPGVMTIIMGGESYGRSGVWAGHGRRDHPARQRRRPAPARRHEDHAARPAARAPAAHRREEGLRPRPVRLVHGAARRA